MDVGTFGADTSTGDLSACDAPTVPFTRSSSVLDATQAEEPRTALVVRVARELVVAGVLAEQQAVGHRFAERRGEWTAS